MKPNLGDCSAAPSPPPMPTGLRRWPWPPGVRSPGPQHCASGTPPCPALGPSCLLSEGPFILSVLDTAPRVVCPSPTWPRLPFLICPSPSAPLQDGAGTRRVSFRPVLAALQALRAARGPGCFSVWVALRRLRSGRPSGRGRGWGQRLLASPPSATEAALPFKVFLREAGTIVQLLRWSV